MAIIPDFLVRMTEADENTYAAMWARVHSVKFSKAAAALVNLHYESSIIAALSVLDPFQAASDWFAAGGMVEWVEPSGADDDSPLFCRCTTETAIKMQKVCARLSKDYAYPNDEMALADFITTHWAQRI